MIILSYTLGMIDTQGNGSDHMLDWHRGQPGQLLTGKACHWHAEIYDRPEAQPRHMTQTITNIACPDWERTVFCQTTTRHTSRAFLPARRECAGCFANVTFPEPLFGARIRKAFASGNIATYARRSLSVLALLCVCLLVFMFASGVSATSLMPIVPDVDVSQPAVIQLASDTGNDTGHGMIDWDSPEVFGMSLLAGACFFATLSLAVLMNENGRARFIYKKRIGSSD